MLGSFSLHSHYMYVYIFSVGASVFAGVFFHARDITKKRYHL